VELYFHSIIRLHCEKIKLGGNFAFHSYTVTLRQFFLSFSCVSVSVPLYLLDFPSRPPEVPLKVAYSAHIFLVIGVLLRYRKCSITFSTEQNFINRIRQNMIFWVSVQSSSVKVHWRFGDHTASIFRIEK
jgi:hypothetical protein